MMKDAKKEIAKQLQEGGGNRRKLRLAYSFARVTRSALLAMKRGLFARRLGRLWLGVIAAGAGLSIIALVLAFPGLPA